MSKKIKPSEAHYTEHCAGEMGIEGLQLCTLCGELLFERFDEEQSGYGIGPVYGTDDIEYGKFTTKYLPEGAKSTKCTQ